MISHNRCGLNLQQTPIPTHARRSIVVMSALVLASGSVLLEAVTIRPP
jgi:hypothetical protein